MNLKTGQLATSQSIDYTQSATLEGERSTSNIHSISKEYEGNSISTAKQLIIEPGATALSRQVMDTIRDIIVNDDLLRSFSSLPALSRVQWIRLVRQSVTASLTSVDSNGSPLSAIETVVEFKGYSPSTFAQSQKIALITSLSTFVDVPPSDINIISIKEVKAEEGRERRLRGHRHLNADSIGDLIWVTFHVELLGNDDLISPEQAIIKNRKAGADAQNGIGTEPISVAVILIASVVGGVVLFIALATVLVILLRRRKRSSQLKTTTVVGGYKDSKQDPARITIPTVYANRPKHRVKKPSIKLPLATAGSPRGLELSVTPQKHLQGEKSGKRSLNLGRRKAVLGQQSLANEQTMPALKSAIPQSNHYAQQVREQSNTLVQPRESLQQLGPKSSHLLRMHNAILQPSEVVHV